MSAPITQSAGRFNRGKLAKCDPDFRTETRTPMKPTPRSKVDPIEREIERALQPGAFIRDGQCFSFVSGLEEIATTVDKLITADLFWLAKNIGINPLADFQVIENKWLTGGDTTRQLKQS